MKKQLIKFSSVIEGKGVLLEMRKDSPDSFERNTRDVPIF